MSDPAWMQAAACKNEPPETFFFLHKRGPHGRRLRKARNFCNDCPVWLNCLNYALAHNIPEGVWGGLLFPNEAKNVRALGGDDAVRAPSQG